MKVILGTAPLDGPVGGGAVEAAGRGAGGGGDVRGGEGLAGVAFEALQVRVHQGVEREGRGRGRSLGRGRGRGQGGGGAVH